MDVTSASNWWPRLADAKSGTGNSRTYWARNSRYRPDFPSKAAQRFWKKNSPTDEFKIPRRRLSAIGNTNVLLFEYAPDCSMVNRHSGAISGYTIFGVAKIGIITTE